MKKALILASVASMIEQFNMNNIKLLQELGYQVDIATNFENSGNITKTRSDELKQELREMKVECYQIDFDRSIISKKNIKAYNQVKKVITENNYNLIHMHSPIGGVCGRLAAKRVRKNGTRVIYTAHGFHFFKGASLLNWIIFYPIEKYLSRYTDCLITINQEDYDLAKRKFKAIQIELVHGVGVDESKFNFEMTVDEKHGLRESLGLKDDDFVLIQVGELNKNKNQIMSINAMKDLVKENSNIHLLLVGKGILQEQYNRKIREYSLEKNIHMLGYRTDIPKLLKISNVLLSLSYREGLPVNVIEGMISGLPVVATDCRGNRELIQNEKNGYIVNISDEKDLINKIMLVVRNKTIVKVKNNLQKYSNSTIKEKMSKIYNSISDIRILHLLSSRTFSGAENVVCQIIKMFDEEKFKMLYCSPIGDIQRKLTNENITYIPLNKMNYHYIKKAIKVYKPDIIHAHDVRASILAALFYKKSKIISHIHGNHDNMKIISMKSVLYCIFGKKFKKIFWVSESAMNEYFFADQVLDKSEVLVNVIDKKQIYDKLKNDYNEYNYDIIYLGRLSTEKDPLRVYEIMKKVVTINNKVKCVLVGDGVFKESLKERIEQDEMNKNIILKGNIENPMKILKSAKVLVMASKYEGTPMCALEAMALGVPIVSTPTDGLVKMVKSGVNGFLSPENEELISEIEKIIIDENYRTKLSENAVKRFDEINNLERYKKRIEREYI